MDGTLGRCFGEGFRDQLICYFTAKFNYRVFINALPCVLVIISRIISFWFFCTKLTYIVCFLGHFFKARFFRFLFLLDVLSAFFVILSNRCSYFFV